MQKAFKITDEDGIHARPATALVNAAGRFKADIVAEASGRRHNMKSILGVLSFGLAPGDVITFLAEGEDAEEALAALEEIFAREGLGVVHD